MKADPDPNYPIELNLGQVFTISLNLFLLQAIDGMLSMILND